MRNEKDMAHTTVFANSEYYIVRSEVRPYNPITGLIYGHTRVYYDVCDADDMLGSFKSYREAMKFIKEVIA